MNQTTRCAVSGFVLLLLGLVAFGGNSMAQSESSVALSGKVTSQAEGAMEGVVVTAQREGSTVMTSVTTNNLGQYSFPRNRMKTGTYTITIRAAGYVLEGSGTTSVTVDAQGVMSAPWHLKHES